LRTGSCPLGAGLVVPAGPGCDFPALLARLHPAASRVARLRREPPASLIAFDLLALGNDDLRGRPFRERRRRLEELLAGEPRPLFLTPATDDAARAGAWLTHFQGAGIDGVVAQHP